MLITFADSLDPDQARRNVGLDLDPNCLTSDGIPKGLFKLIKKSTDEKKHAKLPSMQRVKEPYFLD